MSEATLVVVSRDQMVRIYQQCGFKSADGWTNPQLVSRSPQLSEEDIERVTNEEDKDIMRQIVNKEISFEVQGEKSTKPKTENAKTTSGKSSSPRKTPQKVNQDGVVVKSEPTRINEALSEEPQTFEELAKVTGLSVKRVSEHINYWHKNGKGVGKYLEEVEGKGWKLKRIDGKTWMSRNAKNTNTEVAQELPKELVQSEKVESAPTIIDKVENLEEIEKNLEERVESLEDKLGVKDELEDTDEDE